MTPYRRRNSLGVSYLPHLRSVFGLQFANQTDRGSRSPTGSKGRKCHEEQQYPVARKNEHDRERERGMAGQHDSRPIHQLPDLLRLRLGKNPLFRLGLKDGFPTSAESVSQDLPKRLIDALQIHCKSL